MKKKKRARLENTKHPMQPIGYDQNNIVRFKANSVIQWLFDEGKLDLNQMAIKRFPIEDQRQIAQLLGYSVCGYCDLSYATDKSKDKAWEKMESLPGRK